LLGFKKRCLGKDCSHVVLHSLIFRYSQSAPKDNDFRGKVHPREMPAEAAVQAPKETPPSMHSVLGTVALTLAVDEARAGLRFISYDEIWEDGAL